MDLFDAIKKRYSYRGEFTDEQVSKENLQKIVQAGLDAPSGRNLQTTLFVIVNDLEIIGEIKKVLPEHKTIKTCSALIACIIDDNPELVYYGHHFQIEDCAVAVQNMLLAATALGYATVWLDGVLKLDNRASKIGNIINLPESKKVQIILPIGVPIADGLRKEKLSFNERVWFNGYNN